MSINPAITSAIQNLWRQLNTNGDNVIDKNDNLDVAIQKELGLDEGEIYDYTRVENEYESIMAKVQGKMPQGEKPSLELEAPITYEPQLTDDEIPNISNDEILAGTVASDKIKKYGITHYRYDDCPASRLRTVGNKQVRDDCAAAFRRMQTAAAKEGLNLKIVSGYRSSQYQKQVFKRPFTNKNGQLRYPIDQQMNDRLKYSAPSGFSEHHTGLAIDINETEETFKNTREYKWLSEHAKDFGFEMSFPENNAQGLGFEPWHWRYVGKNGENEEVFAQAHADDPRFNEEIAEN